MGFFGINYSFTPHSPCGFTGITRRMRRKCRANAAQWREDGFSAYGIDLQAVQPADGNGGSVHAPFCAPHPALKQAFSSFLSFSVFFSFSFYNPQLSSSSFHHLFATFLRKSLIIEKIFVFLQTVRGEIRTNKSIRYYFAFSQKPRKLIGNNNALE